MLVTIAMQRMIAGGDGVGALVRPDPSMMRPVGNRQQQPGDYEDKE